MNERATPPEAHLSKDQAEILYEQGERLFLSGTFRFGGAGEGSYEHFLRNRIRYRLDDELIDLSSPGTGYEATPPRIVIISFAIETPLPPTKAWPNTYVQHSYVISKLGWEDLIGARYRYFVAINEYSPEGEFNGDPQGSSRGADLQAYKIEAIQRAYPDYAQLLRERWVTDKFGDSLNRLARLSLMDEVGCEPNPYVRDRS
jgi:hypothetical protein